MLHQRLKTEKRSTTHNINSYVARINKQTEGVKILGNEFSVHLPEDNPDNLGSGWIIRTAFRIDGKVYKKSFYSPDYEIVGYASPRRRYNWSEFKRIAANAVSDEIMGMVERFREEYPDGEYAEDKSSDGREEIVLEGHEPQGCRRD